MILLFATTDSLEVLQSAAGTLDIHASFMDMSQADPPVVKGSTSGKTNTAMTTATTATVVAAPGASVTRNVKNLNIRNKHASLSTDVTVQYDANGTNFELYKTTLAAGQTLEYVEGVGWFLLANLVPGDLIKTLSADDTGGQNVTTAQPWFPTQGGVAVTADTTYRMTGLLCVSRAAGAAAHTTGCLFGGTATLTSIQYQINCEVGETDALLPVSRVIARVATVTTFKASSTTTTEQFSIQIEGIVRINAAGTFIPQFQYITNAPGGTPTIKANSYFRLERFGNGTFVNQGVWS